MMYDSTQKWRGMVLHLYRQVDASMFPSFKWENKSEKTLTAYGNFDQVSFTPVEHFVDYLKKSSSACQWIGGRRDIMLYPLKPSTSIDRHFSFDGTSEDISRPPLVMTPAKRFLIVTMLYISDKVKAKVKNYKQFLDKCQERIENVVVEYNKAVGSNGCQKEIILDVFGTFNSAEIAIVWGSNSFAEVLYLIDQIRYMTLCSDDGKVQDSVFTSAYTIVTNMKDEIEPDQIDDLRGRSIIQLASATVRGQKGANRDRNTTHADAIQFLQEIIDGVKKQKPDINYTINTCAGEYDFVLEVWPPQLQLLSKGQSGKVGPLCSENSAFYEHFSNSTTRLTYEKQDIDASITAIMWADFTKISYTALELSLDTSEIWNELREAETINNQYTAYRKQVSECLSSTSSFGASLDLLYSDYMRAVNTTPNLQWAEDLSLQFNTALSSLSKLLDINNRIDQEYFSNAEKVFQAIRQQIHHITDAGKFFFEEPSSHSESTSEFDLLFHMYYGSLKEVLECIYNRDKGLTHAKQSILVPMLKCRPVPIVESKLYFKQPDIDARLVDITIPYDAWGEPCTFIMSLIHEMYHYVAPFSRTERNELFAKIITCEVIINSIEGFLHTKYTRTPEIHNNITPDQYNQAVIRIMSEIRKNVASYLKRENISLKIAPLLTKSSSPEDVAWDDFMKALKPWYMGTNAIKDNFDSFFDVIMQFACKSLRASMASGNYPHGNKYDEEVLALIELTHKTSDTDTDSSVLRKSLVEVERKWMPAVFEQLRELFPDYAMAKISGLTVPEYMIVFAVILEKLHFPVGPYDREGTFPLRVGFVINELLASQSLSLEERMISFKGFESDFVRLYCAYSRLCAWNNSSIRNPDENVENTGKLWFSFFESMLADFYVQYGCMLDVFDHLAKTQFEPLCMTTRENRIARNVRAFYEALSSECPDREVFESTLMTIWSLQSQKFLCELTVPQHIVCGLQPQIAGIFSTIKDQERRKITLRLDSSNNLLEAMVVATEKLKRSHRKVFGTDIPRHGLWYRGSKNANYDILPSIMVHCFDKDNFSETVLTDPKRRGENRFGVLWQYQRSLIERFKYHADGAQEFINSANYSASDYLAIMQHYQQYTCYLDWSEDAFSSLYFALEPYFENDTTQKSGDKAALYILDPMLYNKARKDMVKKRKPIGKLWQIKQNVKLNNMPDGYIPNLSAKYYPETYQMFSMDIPADFEFSHSKSFHQCSCETNKITLNNIPNEVINLPVAIHTSRLNPRIRTQSGQFMAYSPFARPAYGCNDKDGIKNMNPDRFSYLSLLKIQQFYLDEFPDAEPFVYEIQIRAEIKEELANYLRQVGINRFRIYPELTNLKV